MISILKRQKWTTDEYFETEYVHCSTKEEVKGIKFVVEQCIFIYARVYITKASTQLGNFSYSPTGNPATLTTYQLNTELWIQKSQYNLISISN